VPPVVEFYVLCNPVSVNCNTQNLVSYITKADTNLNFCKI